MASEIPARCPWCPLPPVLFSCALDPRRLGGPPAPFVHVASGGDQWGSVGTWLPILTKQVKGGNHSVTSPNAFRHRKEHTVRRHSPNLFHSGLCCFALYSSRGIYRGALSDLSKVGCRLFGPLCTTTFAGRSRFGSPTCSVWSGHCGADAEVSPHVWRAV
jgi:hypothetical protein